ncbi:MAG: hypothetical protein HY648_02145, partial [Acidobacteria bacterium]|nr:hypothetical protein [Acidobacteriota bacterium]
GSGGGGGGGATSGPGGGGGGGAGGILIAASNTITINGDFTVEGAGGGSPRAALGSGGAIRLVAATIAGSGILRADNFFSSPLGCGGGSSSQSGIIRLEAFTITYNGCMRPSAQATHIPGALLIPPTSTNVSAFIKISKVTNSGNTNETISPSLDAQDVTGAVPSADYAMPDLDATPVSQVTVDLIAGPNTTTTPFPAGKTVTLVVAPHDPAQGAAANYTGSLTCPSPGSGDCTASISGVALPLGRSSFSAFTVLTLDGSGQLAQMFPKEYQGEPIESVRIQTSDKGTEYVLIAKSGRELPYKPTN